MDTVRKRLTLVWWIVLIVIVCAFNWRVYYLFTQQNAQLEILEGKIVQLQEDNQKATATGLKILQMLKTAQGDIQSNKMSSAANQKQIDTLGTKLNSIQEELELFQKNTGAWKDKTDRKIEDIKAQEAGMKSDIKTILEKIVSLGVSEVKSRLSQVELMVMDMRQKFLDIVIKKQEPEEKISTPQPRLMPSDFES